MTEHITWHWQDEENHILMIDYKTGWTWDEHHITLDEMMVRGEADHDFVYVVVDMLNSSFPKGVPTNSQHRDVGQNTLLVIVTDNVFVRTIGQLGVKVLGDQHLYHFAKTMEDANKIIQDHIEMRHAKETPTPIIKD